MGDENSECGTGTPCPVTVPHGRNSRARKDLLFSRLLPDQPHRDILRLFAFLEVANKPGGCVLYKVGFTGSLDVLLFFLLLL